MLSTSYPIQGFRCRQDAGVPDQQLHLAGSLHLRALAGGTVLQVDQAASADQAVLRHVRECGQVANLDRRVGLCPRRHHQKAPQPSGFALHIATDSFGQRFRKNPVKQGIS